MTAIADTKFRDKLMKKKLELKKTIEMIKQNTYERTNRKKHYTGSTDITPRKRSKRRTNTKNGKVRHKTKEQIHQRETMQIL